MHKSKRWLCECREPWPKCEVHRKFTAMTKTVCTKKARQAQLRRLYGTDRPLPRVRTTPTYSEQCPLPGVKVGATKHGDRPQSVQTLPKRQCHKRPQEIPLPDHVEGFDSDGSVDLSCQGDVVERHKRQLDTNSVCMTLPLKRARVNLPADSKLGQRFPHLVRKAIVSPAESNKRRRTLPFKTRGSGDGQCTIPGNLI